MVAAARGTSGASSRISSTASARWASSKKTCASVGASTKEPAARATPTSATGQAATTSVPRRSAVRPSARSRDTIRTSPVFAPSSPMRARIMNRARASRKTPCGARAETARDHDHQQQLEDAADHYSHQAERSGPGQEADVTAGSVGRARRPHPWNLRDVAAGVHNDAATGSRVITRGLTTRWVGGQTSRHRRAAATIATWSVAGMKL